MSAALLLMAMAPTAFAAAASIGAHQAQATACRASLARIPAPGGGGGDVRARAEAAVRSEECLVRANDGALPFLEQAASAAAAATQSEPADVPNAVQTFRDASASLCALLSERSAEAEAPAARAICVATRESDLARLIDGYAIPGRAPNAMTTGVVACDDAFKAKHASADAAAWTALTTCASDDLKAKSHAFVPKVADGDPLGTLGHTPEHVAIVLQTTVSAGDGVCDAIAPQPLARARCRAEVVAHVSKAVAAALH